jgi:hypothetical protein
MDGALARLRWRLRGAWLWPAFVVATAADGVIGHELPPAGASQTMFGAALLGGAFNLLVVLFFSRPLGALIRRRKPELPKFVAKNYGGTWALAAVSLALAAVGLAHRSTLNADHAALDDAIARAQAFIGDHAPGPFRRNVSLVDTYTIETGKAYRICVVDTAHVHSYCVVVRPDLPMARSVKFDGHEPNSVFAQGFW